MTDEDKINKIINRSLKEMSLDAMPNKKADSIEIDYNLNSQGYRCNEFTNQEILILGCSQTEGHGLPLELTWPYLLSKKLNKDYISLAKGGEAAQAQITKAFQFFKEFYKPKYIFAVFPITRMEVPLIGIKTENPSPSNIGKAMFSNKKIQKYSKSPHIIENVLIEEFAIFYNILFIKMLIEYCESNSIELIWTYYNDMSVKMPSFNNLYKGYFESFYLEDDIIKKMKCHSEFSDNQFFDYAADYDYWPPGHWGLHKQIHISESIYDMVVKNVSN